jgi:hypothetical protein
MSSENITDFGGTIGACTEPSRMCLVRFARERLSIFFYMAGRYEPPHIHVAKQDSAAKAVVAAVPAAILDFPQATRIQLSLRAGSLPLQDF